MSGICVNKEWILSLIFILKTVKHNIEGIEILTYDLDKASILLNSINSIQNIIQSLEKIKNNPERYSC